MSDPVHAYVNNFTPDAFRRTGLEVTKTARGKRCAAKGKRKAGRRRMRIKRLRRRRR